MKTALVLGAGGFIGSHLVKRLKSEGYWVRGVDLKYPDFSPSEANEFELFDLRNPNNYQIFTHSPSLHVRANFSEVYQLAALMGGAGFIFTGENDANVMHDSALINLNVLDCLRRIEFKGKVFYSSSACMYPEKIQTDIAAGTALKESYGYQGPPDSEYGWEKLFSERLYLAYQRNHNLNVRIARFHNIYGPEGTYKGGKEKAPAAMCRKVVESPAYVPMDGGFVGDCSIEIWGDGNQTRSFLFIEDCIDAVRLLMVDCVRDGTTFYGPVNIGSEEMVSINELANMAIGFSGKEISINHIDGPQGVRGRNSDNTLIRSTLGWEPKYKLKDGLRLTFDWIKSRYDGNF